MFQFSTRQARFWNPHDTRHTWGLRWAGKLSWVQGPHPQGPFLLPLGMMSMRLCAHAVGEAKGWREGADGLVWVDGVWLDTEDIQCPSAAWDDALQEKQVYGASKTVFREFPELFVGGNLVRKREKKGREGGKEGRRKEGRWLPISTALSTLMHTSLNQLNIIYNIFNLIDEKIYFNFILKFLDYKWN